LKKLFLGCIYFYLLVQSKMGLTCSSDQSGPPNANVSPCPRHRMSPQRDCRACQEFMRSRRPEPRRNQYPARVQQSNPPQMRGQRPPQQGHPPQQAPIGHSAQERYMRNNPVAPHPRRDFSQQMIRGPPREMMGKQPVHITRGQPAHLMGGKPAHMTSGQPAQMMGGQPAHMMGEQPAHMMGGQPLQMMGGQPPQMMGQPQIGSHFQGVLGSVPSAQPPIIQDSGAHIPRQAMPPRVVNQEVPMPTVIQAPAPPPCSTDILTTEMEYQEVLPAQKVVYEQVVIPMPKVITAPAPPPCSTDMFVQDVHSVPQQLQPSRSPQRPTHNTIQPQNYQPRFL